MPVVVGGPIGNKQVRSDGMLKSRPRPFPGGLSGGRALHCIVQFLGPSRIRLTKAATGVRATSKLLRHLSRKRSMCSSFVSSIFRSTHTSIQAGLHSPANLTMGRWWGVSDRELPKTYGRIERPRVKSSATQAIQHRIFRNRPWQGTMQLALRHPARKF